MTPEFLQRLDAAALDFEIQSGAPSRWPTPEARREALAEALREYAAERRKRRA